MKAKALLFLLLSSIVFITNSNSLAEEIVIKDIYSKKSFKEVMLKAEAGDKDAQFSIALRYGEGKEVDKDSKLAISWMEKSANQMNIQAQYAMAMLYYLGEEVPKDDKKAITLMKKAAEHGKPEAQFLLGVMYNEGIGEDQDYKKASVWLRKASIQGYHSAQCLLGDMYAKGKGVNLNKLAARQLIRDGYKSKVQITKEYCEEVAKTNNIDLVNPSIKK